MDLRKRGQRSLLVIPIGASQHPDIVNGIPMALSIPGLCCHRQCGDVYDLIYAEGRRQCAPALAGGRPFCTRLKSQTIPAPDRQSRASQRNTSTKAQSVA